MPYTPVVFNKGFAITPSDTVNLRLDSRLTDAVNVGAAGTVAAVFQDDSVATLTAPAGAVLPIAVKRINATGTTATGLVALYDV